MTPIPSYFSDELFEFVPKFVPRFRPLIKEVFHFGKGGNRFFFLKKVENKNK